MIENSNNTKEKTNALSNNKVNVIYGKGNLKDILDNLLENIFISELEKNNY